MTGAVGIESSTPMRNDAARRTQETNSNTIILLHAIATHLEQHGIVLQELWQIAVSERSDQHDVLILIRVLSLQRSGHHQHGLERTHTKVIMVLL